MNPFQSLLESYTKLRKRTYKFSIISEGTPGQITNRNVMAKGLDSSAVGGINDLREKLVKIGAYDLEVKPLLIRSIPGAENNQSKDKFGDSWITAKGRLALKTKQAFTASFDISQKPMILKLLMAEKGKQESSIHQDAASAQQNPNGEFYVSPMSRLTARNNNKSRGNILKIATNLFPGRAFNWVKSAAAYNAPTPENPYKQAKTTLKMAIDAFFTGEGREFPEEALLEASEDIKTFTKFLEANAGKLEKGECLESTAELEELRNKFFFRNNYLCYGNFEGSNMDTPKLVEAFTEIFEDSERVARVESAQELKSDGTPKDPFLGAMKSAINDPSPCVLISARQRSSDGASNPLIDILHEFNKKLPGVCGDGGKPIWRTESSDTPTTLLSDISETTPQINWLYHQIQKAKDAKLDYKVLEKELGVAMNRIIDFAVKKTEDMDNIIKAKFRLEDESQLDESFMHYMQGKAEASFMEFGSSDPLYRNREAAAKSIARIIALDFAGEGVSSVLRQGNFKGSVDIVMEINGKPINKMTGVKIDNEGVANTMQDTVVKADYAIKCSSEEDVMEIFRLFDIDPTSPDAGLTLIPYNDGEGNKSWYVEVSDKLYSSSDFTSTGMLKMKHALNNDDIFNHHMNSVSHMGVHNKELFKTVCEKARASYKQSWEESRIQLLGDPTKATRSVEDAEADRALLDEKVKARLSKYGNDSGSKGKMVEELALELKKFDKKTKSLKRSDPLEAAETIKTAEKISHLVARVELMHEQQLIGDETLRAQHEVAEAMLYSVGSMSSGVCISNIKKNGKGSERCTDQDQRRILAAAFNGDSNIYAERSGKMYSFHDSINDTVLSRYGGRFRNESFTSSGSVVGKETHKTARRL